MPPDVGGLLRDFQPVGKSLVLAAHVTGPMWKDEAVKFVDDREREARQRYEQLRAEMSGRAVAADIIRGGEA